MVSLILPHAAAFTTSEQFTDPRVISVLLAITSIPVLLWFDSVSSYAAWLNFHSLTPSQFITAGLLSGAIGFIKLYMCSTQVLKG